MALSCELVARTLLGEPHHTSSGESYYHCPNHEDKHPSLKINSRKDAFFCGPCGESGNGWKLAAFFAHVAANDKPAIAHWLKEHGITPNGNGEAAPKKEKLPNDAFREVAHFYYSPKLRNVRFEAPAEDGSKPSKKFQWQRFEKGVWVAGCGDQPKPLYMNTLMRDGDALGCVVGFEGEAKCDLAGQMGIPGFSFKHHLTNAECSKLAGKNVIIWPDADSAGEKQAKNAAKVLFDSGHPVHISLYVPSLDIPLAGDIVDAVKILGWDQEKILSELERASAYPPAPKPISIRLSELSEQPVSWLWKNRLPSGAITILDGDPGTGKSMLAVDIAARVTSGTPFPGETHRNTPANVIFLSSEDSITQTLIPRLRAAGANLARVVTIPYIPEFPGQQTFSRIPKDLEMLGTVIDQEQAKLVIFDVLVSYIPAELSTQRDQDVRLALSPLSMLANRTGVSCLATRHLNKNSGAQAIYRGGGSIAIVGAARCSMLLGRDPANPDTRVLAVVKSNLGIIPPSLNMTIVTENGVARAEWLGESSQTPDSLLAASTPESKSETSALSEAVDFLKQLLADGPAKVEDIKNDCRQNLISTKTMYRAKSELSIKSYRVGFGSSPWWWELK